MIKFKTKPYKHQRKALNLSADREYFALLMEQGTGKSWVLINTAAHLRRAGKIDTVLIIAPKGVAPGWTRQQFPTHMPDDVPYHAGQWKAKSRMTKRAQRELSAALAEKEKLRVIVMNIEPFGSTADALDFALDVLGSAKSALVAIDESHRIKNPSASTTKRILKLRLRSNYRRILTGTVADKPFDVFSQFGFLSEEILGTPSFAAFKTEYAEMLPASAGLIKHIIKRNNIPFKWDGKYIDDDTGNVADGELNADGSPRKKHMVPRYIPSIVATDSKGQPRYKNLDQLHELIAPHSFRVLKSECLDLPPKLYNRYYTELTERQEELYNQIRDQQRVEWEDGRITTFSKLTTYLRLQQVICGYLPTDDGHPVHEIFRSWEENPRIVDTLECISDRPEEERTIIWCRFVPDILRLTEALRESYGSSKVVQFYGDTPDKLRLENVARFEGVREVMGKSGNLLRKEEVPDSERARFMIAQPQSGGVGQTWNAASLSLHYSNLFSLIDRLQAEDRPHRIGQTKTVNYIDIECEDTIDSIIIDSLINKKDVADVINGDKTLNWLRL